MEEAIQTCYFFFTVAGNKKYTYLAIFTDD